MKINFLLFVACLGLLLFPLISKKEAQFTGSDQQALEKIEKENPNYIPWISPFWEPPSGEIESLLFGLQAAVGAGLVGFCLGYWQRGKSLAKKASYEKS